MNGIYDTARYALSTAGIDWRAAELMLTAWAGEPTFAPEDRIVGDLIVRVGVDNKLGDSLPIVDSTVTPDGYNQTSSVVIQDVPLGREVTFFTMSLRQAVPEQSELFLFIDTAVGMPFISNNLDIVVIPDWAQARGWFRA
jgi:hypothetical protein